MVYKWQVPGLYLANPVGSDQTVKITTQGRSNLEQFSGHGFVSELRGSLVWEGLARESAAASKKCDPKLSWLSNGMSLNG